MAPGHRMHPDGDNTIEACIEARHPRRLQVGHPVQQLGARVKLLDVDGFAVAVVVADVDGIGALIARCADGRVDLLGQQAADDAAFLELFDIAVAAAARIPLDHAADALDIGVDIDFHTRSSFAKLPNDKNAWMV